MVEAIRPSIFTLPFGGDLCEQTVELVLKQCGPAPLAISRATIFLPNNRAIRAMQEAFVRRAENGLLMPRLIAIGDLALDEALSPMLDPVDGEADTPGLIGPLRRQLILAGLIRQQYRKQAKEIDATEVMRLARLLAELIDELDIEKIGPKAFEELAGQREVADDPDLAGHWQSSYENLLEILPLYRKEMQKLGLEGPAALRNILLARLKDRLGRGVLPRPVFASGISTAAPAIADLLSAIAKLAGGHVILPHIDLGMDDEGWEELGPPPQEKGKLPEFGKETHPQFHLKLLLERMGVNRGEVALLGSDKRNVAGAINSIFCLPEATTAWSLLTPARKKLPSLRLTVAEDSAEEALAIAIMVRRALEEPGKRIAIATPDRELAKRISEQLKRWDIAVDDTAGKPLLQTPPGMLLVALAQMVADQFSASSLLGVAKHPLVRPEHRLEWLEMTRALDMELRGPSPGLGLKAITRQLARAAKNPRNKARKDELKALQEWWKQFAEQISPLEKAVAQGFDAFLATLADIAGELSDGAIWKKAEGRQLSAFLDELSGHDFNLAGHIEREALPAFFAELVAGQVVRPPYGGHPRVALFGLLEARLQQADLLICAGLNEGSWPQLPTPDPWLAPRIRRQLGLPALERNIGLSAHDLAGAIGAKECIITRARRDRAGPTVASRFLLRIEAFLGSALQQEEEAIALARKLDQPEASERHLFPAPEIRPSAAQRAVRLSVTDFDRLLSDPFAIYAKRILRLQPLDSVDAGATHAWRGTLVHDILEKWADEDNSDPARLMQRVDCALGDAELHPGLRVLWQPRILQGLKWVAEETQRQMDAGRNLLLAEADGKIQLAGTDVTGKVDRIDLGEDGSLTIIDYKTGQPPAPKQINAGYALQLGLLGHMAINGCFARRKRPVAALEYWSLAKDQQAKDGANPFGYRRKLGSGRSAQKKASEDLIADMVARAEEAIEKWIKGDAPFVAKLRPEFTNYDDYDQLSRLQEWDQRQSQLRSAGERA